MFKPSLEKLALKIFQKNELAHFEELKKKNDSEANFIIFYKKLAIEGIYIYS